VNKTHPLLLLFIFSALLLSQLNAQTEAESDSTGLPGDQFSLEGALDLFKKSASIEEFEKLLNTSDNHVNNLDLNEDGEVDYVRVVEVSERDVHAFALQVSVSDTENQDIAVIELEKTGAESAVAQIIGDEDIYGEQIIIEPGDGDEEEIDDEEQKGGPSYNYWSEAHAPIPVVINVWLWPSVRFVYAPGYRVWVSPWRWRVYPAWWRPWKPLPWRVFHPFRVRHRVGFAVVRTHRVVHAHRIYTPHRTVSVMVSRRHSGTVKHYRTTHTVMRTKHGMKVKTTRSRIMRKRH